MDSTNVFLLFNPSQVFVNPSHGQIITSAFPAVVFLLLYTYFYSPGDSEGLTQCQFADHRLIEQMTSLLLPSR